MTQQAKNALALYKGGNPSVIKQLLMRQSKSVVEELKQYHGLNDLESLSVRLSLG